MSTKKDELIDLSPCIGIYQESMFFSNYDINSQLDFVFSLYTDLVHLKKKEIYELSLEEKYYSLFHLKQGSEDTELR